MGYVCMYVYPNKKKFSTDLKNSFFPGKVWTLGVTAEILEVSNRTPSCRKPDKPSKNRVFLTSETVLRRFTDRFRQKWTQGVTWAILEVSNTTPSCRKSDKPPKTGVFGLLRQIYCLISTKLGTNV